MFKVYKKDDEQVISTNIGYPYDVIPKGYPYSIKSRLIKQTIKKMVDHMKANAGSENKIDFEFINIGSFELNNRKNRIQFNFAVVLSLLSFSVAIFSLLLR